MDVSGVVATRVVREDVYAFSVGLPPPTYTGDEALDASVSKAMPAAPTALSDLAFEIVDEIAALLSVRDTLQLVSTNRDLLGGFRAARIRYRDVVISIGAVCDVSSMERALAACARLPDAVQPALLRAFAQSFRERVPCPWGAAALWRTRLDRLSASVAQNVDSLSRHEARRDLLIAKCMALFPERARDEYRHRMEVLSEMGQLPILYRASILDALLPTCGPDAIFSEIAHFARQFTGRLNGTSLPFAIAVADVLLMQDRRKNVSDILCERFGVPLDVQRAKLDAVIARRISTSGHTEQFSIAAQCALWRPGDHVFFAVAEQSYLRVMAPKLLVGEMSWPTSGGAADGWLAAGARHCLLRMETDTFAALGANAFVMESFFAMYERIGQTKQMSEWWCLHRAASAMEMSAQAALMHRLADRLAHCTYTLADVNTVVVAFKTWRRKIVRWGYQMGSPSIIVRATAATISARQYQLPFLPMRTSAKIRQLATAVFADVPAHYWTPVLDALARLPVKKRDETDGPFLDRYLDRFLLAPETSVSVMSVALSWRICRRVAVLWDRLPDRPNGVSTRFEAFCARIDLHDEACVAARERVLYRLGLELSDSRLPIASRLAEEGFKGVAALHYVENLIWARTIRPMLLNDTADHSEAIATFSQTVLHFRFRIAFVTSGRGYTRRVDVVPAPIEKSAFHDCAIS